MKNCTHAGRYAAYHCTCWVCAQRRSAAKARLARQKLDVWLDGPFGFLIAFVLLFAVLPVILWMTK
jgi:hypothetical protein